MNASEFGRWLGYHDAMFPGFAGWYATNVGESPDGRQAWIDGLNIPSLDACKEASRELLHGDIQAEGGYTSHLKAIRARATVIQSTRISTRRGPGYADGMEVVNCPDCLDCGTVEIWRPEVMADALSGKVPEPKTCRAACGCGAMAWHIEGDGTNRTARVKHSVGKWPKLRLPVYDEGADYHFVDVRTKRKRRGCIAKATGYTMAEKLESITSAASAFDTPESRPNYSQDLANWNEP